MHDHHGNTPAAVGRHGEQLGLPTGPESELLEEAAVLVLPDGGGVERISEDGGGLDLERDTPPRDLDPLPLVGDVKIPGALETRAAGPRAPPGPAGQHPEPGDASR